MSRWWRGPEVNIALFSFLLHLVWELVQVPFFAGMPSSQHWVAIRICARATAGDAVIAVVIFWAVAAIARSRSWILAPTRGQVSGFVGTGLLVTIVVEWLSTQVLGRWAYGSVMPVVPVLRIGVLPILQWIVIPPVVLWMVRRQMLGTQALFRRERA